MKKTRLEIVQECKNAIERMESFQRKEDTGHRITIEIGKQFYQDVIDAYEEEQAKKPLTLIYTRTVMRQGDIDRLTEYYEQRFGTKVVVLGNQIGNVVQIDPESNIGTMFINAQAER